MWSDTVTPRRVPPWQTVSKGGILNAVTERMVKDDNTCPRNNAVAVQSAVARRCGFERKDVSMCVCVCAYV